ncbi:MAG: InlB B-repeat-containing protein, partial [Ruminiclostridium sp.]|nr:InlB B-repeat-containing protein [Ruminiclostridium sp.]
MTKRRGKALGALLSLAMLVGLVCGLSLTAAAADEPFDLRGVTVTSTDYEDYEPGTTTGTVCGKTVTFAGWYDNAQYTGNAVSSNFGDGPYYARWTLNNTTVVTSTVTIDFDGEISPSGVEGSGIAWDRNTSTLTLTNAAILVPNDNAIKTFYGYAGTNLTVVLAGSSTVISESGNYGMSIASDLTLRCGTAAGSLTVTGDLYGISSNGDLTIADSAVVTASGVHKYGIYSPRSLTVRGEDTVVTAVGGSEYYYGVYYYNDGIYANGDILIADGAEVTATGDGHGIRGENIIIDGNGINGIDVTASSTQGQAIGGTLQTTLPVWEGDDAATAQPSTVDYSQGATTEAKFVSVYAAPTPPTPSPAEPAVITVTFHANGGQCSFTSAVAGEDGTLDQLPTAAQIHHTFGGWYTAKNGGTQVTTDTVFTKSTTLYAHWTKITSNGSPGPVGPV